MGYQINQHILQRIWPSSTAYLKPGSPKNQEYGGRQEVGGRLILPTKMTVNLLGRIYPTIHLGPKDTE